MIVKRSKCNKGWKGKKMTNFEKPEIKMTINDDLAEGVYMRSGFDMLTEFYIHQYPDPGSGSDRWDYRLQGKGQFNGTGTADIPFHVIITFNYPVNVKSSGNAGGGDGTVVSDPEGSYSIEIHYPRHENPGESWGFGDLFVVREDGTLSHDLIVTQSEIFPCNGGH